MRYLRDRLAQALLDAKIDGLLTADIGEVVDALLPVVRNEVQEEKAGATRLYIRYRDARDEVTAERDALAAKLAKAEVSALPDSEHMARRMEDIAAKAVEAVIERDAARARVRELEGGS